MAKIKSDKFCKMGHFLCKRRSQNSKKKWSVNNLWPKWVVSYLTQNKQKKYVRKILWKSDKFHKMGHFLCRKVGKEVRIQTKSVQWTILYSKWVVSYITQTLLFLLMAWTPISNIHQPIAAYFQKIIMNFWFIKVG